MMVSVRDVDFSMIFDESDDAIFLSTSSGSILKVNKKACEMLGYEKNKLLDMTLFDISPEGHREKATKKDDSFHFESEWFRSDGSLINVDVSSAVVDPEDMIIQGIGRDITERKRAEKALLEREYYLKEAQL